MLPGSSRAAVQVFGKYSNNMKIQYENIIVWESSLEKTNAQKTILHCVDISSNNTITCSIELTQKRR